ncbi:TPA: filamentous hemagglutinin N-terminal domain-containing protein [Salmonella enterica subsp. enterica serovar Welikade]
MNKIYKLKYDRRRNQLVAVSELTTGAGKEATGSVAGECGLQGVSTFRRLLGTLTPLAVLTGLVIGMLPGLALANPDLPVGGQVVAGQGSISTSGNQMTIHQGTHGLVTNWHSFDIGQNHTVQFVQPDSSAVALNRVTGGHESQILGTLTANGQVMLVNPAGVMFGKGARVNTAGLLASTKNISTEDFMAGRYTFSGGSHPGAEIVNQGSLTTTKGGYIVLAADRVRNSGTLSTPSGKTVLAAADRVTLQLDNTGLASVSVNGSVVNALVENSGLIAATNGQVYLTARGKEMLLNTVVNNSGTVEARGLNQRGGEIVLDGGESGVVSQSGMLLADSETGRGGKITVQGTNIHLAGGSRTSATGRTGGGGVYVGGGWQGKDVAIRNASKVVMDRDAVIDVSATEKGDGGKAVLWSEDYTNFRGRILAKGGTQSGNGGQVETSSHHNLQAFGDVEASALNGRGGNWLLDPEDISIVNATTNTNVSGCNNDSDCTFVPSTSGSQVGNGTIEQRLNNGTSVTIKTAKEDGDTGSGGNITFESSISKTAGSDASLTLDANGSINITNHSINATVGKLDVNLYAAGSNDGSILLNNASITTNGGNITLGRKEGAEAGKYLNIDAGNQVVLNSGTGDVSLNAVANGSVGVYLHGVKITGGNITVNASSVSGGSAVKIEGNNTLTASRDISITGNRTMNTAAYGVRVMSGSTFTAGNNITIAAVATNGSDGALKLEGLTLNATDSFLSGTSGSGTAVGVTGNITVERGNLLLSGNSSSGIGISVNSTGINVSAGNLTLSGNVARGGGAGVSLKDVNVSAASGNITMSGKGYDSSNGSLSVTGNNTFSAQNTVLSGEAGRNNIGTKLSGNLTVMQGNLSVSGTANQQNGGGYTGLLASNLTLNVSGALSMEGGITGKNTGTTTALNLTNVTINAVNASLKGSNANSGVGFLLDNVTLQGGIVNGANLSLSSANSGNSVTNKISSGVLGMTETEALMKKGIENNTQIDARGMTLGGSGDDWSENYTSSKGGGWIFSNAQINKNGNISLQGVGFVDSNITAGKDLTINNHDGSLIVTNSNLTSTGGKVSLTGGRVNISGGNITALHDVNVSGNNSGVAIKGTNNTTGLANITSTSGNISVLGYNSGTGSVTGVTLTNVSLNASQGNITVNGTTPGIFSGVRLTNVSMTADKNKGYINVYAESQGYLDSYAEKGSLYFAGKGEFSAANLSFTGVNKRAGSYNSVGLAFDKDSNISFSGNTTINATGGKGMDVVGGGSLSFSNGTSVINAKAEAEGGDDYYGQGAINFNYIYNNPVLNLSVNNGDLSIIASSEGLKDVAAFNMAGLGTNAGNGIIFSGNGNVTLTGKSDGNTGLSAGMFNNEQLTGHLTINGQSSTGTGVLVNSSASSHLINASINGISQTGTGLLVTTSGASSVNLNGNTLTGTSGTGTGISVSGNNVTITNGTLNGTSGGSGAGVELTGGTNYTVDGATVQGSSQAGSGVSVGGNLSVSNATVNGTTVSGSGVNIGGNLTSSNTSINGTASGNGSGVSLNGNVTGDETEKNVITGHSAQGNGVLVSGNSTATNVTLNGDTVDGNGIKVTGNLTANNVAANGNASGNGNGVNLAGNVSGGQWHGDAANGTGVNVTGDSTLTDVSLNGTTENGTGINVPGNLTSEGTTTVTGNATGNGTGAAVSGTLNGDIDGSSASGTGAAVNGTINGTINGTSTSGTGSVVGDGANISQGSQVNGQSGSGTGSVTEGNVTNQGSISGQSDKGTGTALGGNLSGNGLVTGTTNGPGDGVSLSGNVTGGVVTGHADNGAGVNISGNSTLTNVSVNGSTVHGTGVDVNGNLTNTGNTDVSGHASAGGTGVHIHQGNNVTGGSLAGTSVSGPGVVIDGDNTLSNTTVNGGSGSNSGLVLNGNVNGTGSVLSGQSGSGDGVNLNGTMTGGSLNAHSGSGAGLHITGDSWLKDVETTYDSDTGAPLLIDGLLSFTGGTLNGVTQGDQAAERHYLWLLQPPREQTSGPEQLMRMAGWQARDVPVGVDVCTDSGESSSCRHLDAGMRNRPSHP